MSSIVIGSEARNHLKESVSARRMHRSEAAKAARKSADHIALLQKDDGSWCIDLAMDVRQIAEYVFLYALLNRPEKLKRSKIVRHLLRKQRSDGGWDLYHKGHPDPSTSVTAYYALKLLGCDPSEPFMKKARDYILKNGGAMAANCFTRFYLCLFGQMNYSTLPAFPLELVLLPRTAPFNLYTMSYWSRVIIVPLIIIVTVLNKRPFNDHTYPTIDELFMSEEEKNRTPYKFKTSFDSYIKNLFLMANNVIKRYERFQPRAIKTYALKTAEKWMIERMGGRGGFGAIFPSMVNSVLALKVLGYSDDHALMTNELNAIDRLLVENDDEVWLQPCISPIWDTAWSLYVLQRSDSIHAPDAYNRHIDKSIEYILARQTKRAGDWQLKLKRVVTPGGWYFQDENELYPDIDDTAIILLALHPYRNRNESTKIALKKGLNWILAMQSKDGAWAAFDRHETVREIFNHVPFAEHGALLDTLSPDITGRVLEMLGAYGFDSSNKQIKKALIWLRKTQKKDGSWYGRWGVNYIYGTWAVFQGLASLKIDRKDPIIKRGIDFLIGIQNHDGGWGESCASYRSNGYVKDISTPSQTAWALLALLHMGLREHPAVRSGIDYLLDHQLPNGSWEEESFVGTGFPNTAYLKYDLYKDLFPCLALTKYFSNT